MKLESKIGNIKQGDEKIYNFLIDFDNLKNLAPADKVQNWQSDNESCRFTVSPIGEVGVKILDREPFKLIKLTGIDNTKYTFYFWIQIKQIAESDSRIKLTMEVELNQMMQMMVKKPLQEFLNKVIDQLEKVNFTA